MRGVGSRRHNSSTEARHGSDDQLQAAGWAECAGVPRGARGRERAGRGGDPGVVGAERPDQRSGRPHGRRRIPGARAGSLPRESHRRGEGGRAPDDQPQLRRRGGPGRARRCPAPEGSEPQGRRHRLLPWRGADAPCRRQRPRGGLGRGLVRLSAARVRRRDEDQGPAPRPLRDRGRAVPDRDRRPPRTEAARGERAVRVPPLSGQARLCQRDAGRGAEAPDGRVPRALGGPGVAADARLLRPAPQVSGRPAATTTGTRGADWVVAWDARTRRVYRFHADVAFEGETITSSGLGYAGLYPGGRAVTFAAAIAFLLSAEAGRAAPPDKTTVVNCSKGTITRTLTGTGPMTLVLQGTCTENVIITRDDVTLTTAGVTAATVVAADPGLPAILVDVQLEELVTPLLLDPRRGKVGARDGVDGLVPPWFQLTRIQRSSPELRHLTILRNLARLPR